MAKRVKARASVKASVKVGATAKAITHKRAKNLARGVKLHYNDKGAMALAQAIDTVATSRKVNPHGKATGKALANNASERRAWCLANLDACVIVKRETIQRKEIDTENPRPENAIRARLSTHELGAKVGYIRYLSTPEAKAKPKHKHAESVILYRKA